MSLRTGRALGTEIRPYSVKMKSVFVLWHAQCANASNVHNRYTLTSSTCTMDEGISSLVSL